MSANGRIKVGDLVTRTYDYVVDSIPEASHPNHHRPYGIVLEIKQHQLKDRNQSVVVYLFKEGNAYAEKRRVNNARFLKVVNSVDEE